MQRTLRIPIWSAPRPLLALAILSAGALAQVSTVLPFHRTADLLVGDATSGRILRAHDADLDGAYASPGELTDVEILTATSQTLSGEERLLARATV